MSEECRRIRFVLIPLLGLVLCVFQPARADDDWPQWRGPSRDGVWRESGIFPAVPGTGLKTRWRAKIGRGYSGPVVAEGRVLVTDHVFDPELERVLCFDEQTGQRLWMHSYPVDYRDMEYGNGPRASPTVADGRVYTLGTQADFCCLDAATGKLLWQKDLAKDHDARVPQYGASVAPLVEGDVVIVSVGGQPQACVIALDRVTGERRWTALDDRPAYSAPLVVERGGCRQLIVWTADGVNSLNPANGDVYWRQPWKTTFDAAQVVASPVLHKDRLLLVMAWNRGSRMLRLAADKPEATLLWSTRTRPTTTMSTPFFLDDDHFCSIDNVGGLCCLDANTGEEVWRTTEVAGSGPLAHAHLTPNGNRVFLFNQRGQLISARITPEGYTETGRTLLVEPTAGHRAQGPVAWAHPAYANRHVIARNDRLLVRASLAARDYPAGDDPAENQVESKPLLHDIGGDAILSLTYSPDGRTLALGTWSGKVKLLEMPSGKVQSTEPPGIRNNCSAIAISPDNTLLAYAGGSEFAQASNNYQQSGKIRLWDLAAGKPLGFLEGHASKVTSVAFSPDGATLATGSADNSIRLWDAATREEQTILKGHTEAVWSLAWLPDGDTLASVGWDRTLRFWNTKTEKQLAQIDAHEEEILSVAVSPDGRTIATGSADWTVCLWDAAAKTKRTTLTGHRGAIYSLAFSPDGRTLASGGGDETIRLWNTTTAAPQALLTGHRSGITALAFSPDGHTLITAGRDDPPRRWTLAPSTP